MDYIDKLLSQQKYIWEYFKAHSSQRLITFNFYLLILTFLCTAYGYSMRDGKSVDPAIRMIISYLLFMFSITFFFLDKRCKKMIKNAEKALKELEVSILPSVDKDKIPAIHIFEYEENKTNMEKKHNKKICWMMFWKMNYSYSDCFRTIFVIGGLIGFLGFSYGLCYL